MNKEVSFFNVSIHHILPKDKSALDQARIHLLYYGLILGFFSTLVLLFYVKPDQQPLLMLTDQFFALTLVVLFKYLTWKADWRAISHALLLLFTAVNLSSIYIVLQNVNAVTMQFVILVIGFSFYMLGQKWGIIYSALNIIPAITFLVIDYERGYITSLKPEKIDPSIFVITLVINFILIVLIHNHFYTAFVKNIRQLKRNTDEQTKLNVQLEAAMQKAEKSSQAKTEFLSTMSHEIRTPLNAVIGMGNLLVMNNPRDDQKENLEILKFSANNLLAIVNDVLDFNKIEAGRISFEKIRFNLVELMQNICGAQIIRAREKNLTFKLEIDPQLQNKIVVGDPTRITQVIYNLISNAIKFTERGNVWLRVRKVEESRGNFIVNFVVKDTGIGIEKDNLELIFEPFAQESVSTTRKYGGTGLCLAIVKRLLELQGINMKVTSQPGEGSQFSFNMEFPVIHEKVKEEVVPAAQVPAEVPAVLKTESLGNISVLIAEDNPVNVMLMKKLFSKWKLTPVFAENGAIAVERVKYGNFDIVLMDLQMPVMDGLEATSEIRKLSEPVKANVPIIALTASALFDIKERVAAAGINDYVSKPFKPDELKEKMFHLALAV